jgi:hypothetical protein
MLDPVRLALCNLSNLGAVFGLLLCIGLAGL